jgi:uncharacterized membrane protein
MDITEKITSPDVNVSEPERWLSVVAGAAMAAYGLTRRSVSGLFLAGLGGGLVWRGATGHCAVYDALGHSTATETDGEGRQVSVPYGKGIRVEKSVTVNASPERLYTFWRNLENLPRFMKHLEAVKVIDSKRSHWTAKGPAGSNVEWDAEVINEIPNELIGWRSIEGSQVSNAGSVRFAPATGGRGTEVKVEIEYTPPAGKVGAIVAMLFGKDPAHEVGEDLRSFKMLLETGELARVQ